MSLNWEFRDSQVADALAVRDPDQKAITDVLIWGTMVVGIGSITAKNVDEWLYRLEVLAVMGDHLGRTNVDPKTGAHLDRSIPWNPSRKDLEARISLVTNTENRTRKQWLDSRMQSVCRRADERLANEREAARRAAEQVGVERIPGKEAVNAG